MKKILLQSRSVSQSGSRPQDDDLVGSAPYKERPHNKSFIIRMNTEDYCHRGPREQTPYKFPITRTQMLWQRRAMQLTCISDFPFEAKTANDRER